MLFLKSIKHEQKYYFLLSREWQILLSNVYRLTVLITKFYSTRLRNMGCIKSLFIGHVSINNSQSFTDPCSHSMIRKSIIHPTLFLIYLNNSNLYVPTSMYVCTHVCSVRVMILTGFPAGWSVRILLRSAACRKAPD